MEIQKSAVSAHKCAQIQHRFTFGEIGCECHCDCHACSTPGLMVLYTHHIQIYMKEAGTHMYNTVLMLAYEVRKQSVKQSPLCSASNDLLFKLHSTWFFSNVHFFFISFLTDRVILIQMSWRGFS